MRFKDSVVDAMGARKVSGQKLKNVEINPGRLCNNKCVFCMSGEERDDHEPWADVGRMKLEIKTRFEEGARSLGFLGGEPTTYPHIIECIRFAKEIGYLRIALCTNGMRLANLDFLDECIASGLTRVTVSVHSHRSDIEELLVCVPGILERKIRAISNLVKRRDQGLLPDGVSVNPVFSRPNAPHSEDYMRFFMGLGIRDFRFNFIRPESKAKDDKDLIPQFHEVVPHILRLILRNEKEWKVSLSFGAIPYCVLPVPLQSRWPLLRKYFYEESNDLPTDVSYLVPGTGGGVHRFNWQQQNRDFFRIKVDSCRSCGLNDVCAGIYRDYLGLYGNDEFVPVLARSEFGGNDAQRTAFRFPDAEEKALDSVEKMLLVLPGSSFPAATAYRAAISRGIRRGDIRLDYIYASMELGVPGFRVMANVSSGQNGFLGSRRAICDFAEALDLKAPSLIESALAWASDPSNDVHLGVACDRDVGARIKVYFGSEGSITEDNLNLILNRLENSTPARERIKKIYGKEKSLFEIGLLDDEIIEYKIYTAMDWTRAEKAFKGGTLLTLLRDDGWAHNPNLHFAACCRLGPLGEIMDYSLYVTFDLSVCASPEQLAFKYVRLYGSQLEERVLRNQLEGYSLDNVGIACACLSEGSDLAHPRRHVYFKYDEAKNARAM